MQGKNDIRRWISPQNHVNNKKKIQKLTKTSTDLPILAQ